MIKCKNCGKPTKNKKFCSRECCNLYKFRKCRKKKRSKLEIYLSNRLKQEHPWLLLEECNRTILNNLELDIFLPQFNIAIEINGAMHYKFVKYFHHTIKNFQKQRVRDYRKKIKCQQLGIQLIEIPNLKSFNEKDANQIYNWLIGILKNLTSYFPVPNNLDNIL